MDQIDRVTDRVCLATLVGLIGGAATATYRGTPIAKSGISVAGTCALIGTACFGLERVSYFVLEQTSLLGNISSDTANSKDTNSSNNNTNAMYASHTIGGITGGGIVGGLFHKRPMSGMLVFTPIMVGIAYAELQLQDARQQRLQEAAMALQSSSLKIEEGTTTSNQKKT